jgi:predicted oxidoreductase
MAPCAVAVAASALALVVVIAQPPTVVPRCNLGPVDVSCVAMGTLHLHEAVNASGALGKIQAALALGLTTWDLSDVYSMMPGLFGEALALQPGLREQLQIIAKMDIVGPLGGSFGFDTGSSYDSSPEHLNSVLDAYLAALNSTYVDVVLLHRQDYLLDFAEMAQVAGGWIAGGKVKAFGVSNFDRDSFAGLAARIPLVANEIELSPLRPQPLFDGTVSFHYANNVTVLAWSPLGGDPWGMGQNRLFGIGSLDGTQRNQRIRSGLQTVATALNTTSDVVAIAWLLRHPAPIIPIIGTMQPSRMAAQSLGALAVLPQMTRQQWYHISDAVGVPIY